MVISWSIQICQAIEHMNACGIRAHRDLKPGNILIGPDRVARITDFGLAAALDRLHVNGKSLFGQHADGELGLSVLVSGSRILAGTPGYIAPEIFAGRPADVQSDLYSFGIVLWQMTTKNRRPPGLPEDLVVQADWLLHICRRQQNGIPRVQGALDRMIQRCVAPASSSRFHDFRELRQSLEALGQPGGPRMVRQASSAERPAVWVRKAWVERRLHRPESAIETCKAAIAIDPSYAEAWHCLGSCQLSRERWAEAVESFAQAVRLDPQIALAWYELGLCLWRLKRFDEAVKAFDKALALGIDEADTWLYKGYYLHDHGFYGEAIDCFERGLSTQHGTIHPLPKGPELPGHIRRVGGRPPR